MKPRLVVLLAAALWVLAPRSGAWAQSPSPADTAQSPQAPNPKPVVVLPVIEVSTARADSRSPIARSVLDREELERVSWGQDTPMALATLPGAYAYSDAGNGIGYSYLSIRGFPQRRISVLIDGVPLNDPESHEVYWIDHPDLLASTAEAQVQRGVGSALYGAASLGGSVNLETSPYTESPAASALFAYGSFETSRLMLETNSGRLAGDWNFYGRYSRIRSGGYRFDSFSRLWSYYLSARKTTAKHTFRLNLFGGPEETHLAYLGIPPPYLNGEITGDADMDRRFNPITYPNERDHFFEPHYELIHSWQPSERLTFSQTLFYFDGRGYYDERRFGGALADYRLSPWATSDSTLFSRDYYAQNPDGSLAQDSGGRFTVERFDLVRRRTIDNRHFGWVPRVRLEHGRGGLTFGGEIRHHDGHHWGDVIQGSGLPPGTPPDFTYYNFHPRTLSAAVFAREELWAREDWLVTADLGWRHQSYYMRDDRFDGIRFDQPYDFALPRLGVSYFPDSPWAGFLSWSRSSREPALRDLYDGEGIGNVPLYRTIDVARGIFQDPLIRPEKVNDFEAELSWRKGLPTHATLNLFRMSLRDELVFAGQFNTDLGYPILGNAARSVHQGVELAGRWHVPTGTFVKLALGGNTTLSDNHFVRYREIYGTNPGDTVSYDGNRISLFPSLLAKLGADVSLGGLTLGASARHVGRIYVDNTENRVASIDPNTTVELAGGYRFITAGGSHVELLVRLLNAFDKRYETSGYLDFDASGNLVPHLIPAATRSVLGQVRVDF